MSNDDTALTPDSGERYERGERIATGGMGEVWRARDNVLGREVAVKILKHEYADDATFRARFAAEARHAAGLHHPGIASVFDYGLLQEGQPYLVMELVNGKPLSDLLADGRPFDPEQARALALQTAEALAVAHEAGVVHRDVKPANLLVTPDGQVKITDFGIARAANSVAFTQTGQIVGTPHYLSPEQARGDAATAASDVYALGVVLFECLSGQRPFNADTPIATALAQIQQDIPPLPDTVPPALAAVVTRSLAKDPAERYADGAEFATALRGVADGADPAPPVESTRVLAATPTTATRVTKAESAPPADSTTRNRSRWPLYAAIALALLLLAALLIWSPWSDVAETTDGDPAADTVKVNKGQYVGQPVGEVRSALGDKGLETKVETEENPGGEDAGTVADLSPTGVVDKGEVITLQVWDDPPAPAPQTEEPDNSGPDNSQEPEKTKEPKPEKTKEPEPEKTEKPDNSGPGGEDPTDGVTEGAPVNPDGAEQPAGSGGKKPDKTKQSGTGTGE